MMSVLLILRKLVLLWLLRLTRIFSRRLLKPLSQLTLPVPPHWYKTIRRLVKKTLLITLLSGSAAGDVTDPAKLAKSIFDAKKEMDKKNVPSEGAFVVLPPDQYYALLDVTDGNKLVYMNRDFGGTGSVSSGVVPSIAGMPVYMSNHLVVSDPDFETGATNKGQSKGNRPLANTAGSDGQLHTTLLTQPPMVLTLLTLPQRFVVLLCLKMQSLLLSSWTWALRASTKSIVRVH